METSFLSPYTKCLGLLVNEGSWLKKKKKKTFLKLILLHNLKYLQFVRHNIHNSLTFVRKLDKYCRLNR